MRVALLSDIHANLPALEAVLKDMKGRNVDVILHAGDIVGYNPFPNEVIEVIRREGIQSIQGNHDRAIFIRNDYWFNSVAAEALRWTREHLVEGSLGYLRALKLKLEREFGKNRLLMVHGSPSDDDEYVYERDVTDDTLPETFSLLAMGHTHIAFRKDVSRGMVLNPGSVGQPRDGDPRASYAILGLDGIEISFHRVAYPVEETSSAIRAEGLPEFLAERLEKGL